MSSYQRYVVVKGEEEATGKNALLNNDDLCPLSTQGPNMDQLHILYVLVSGCHYRYVSQIRQKGRRSEGRAVSNWYGASATQAPGLSMWEVLACSIGGQILIAIVITLNGRADTIYDVDFPISSRAALGILGGGVVIRPSYEGGDTRGI